MYIKNIFVYLVQIKSSTMKRILITLFVIISIGEVNAFTTEPTAVSKKKNTTELKRANKNVHSLKKWKIMILYTNGNKISKTIVVGKNSKKSALDTAFEEAEKYLKNEKKIKEYTVTPVTNSYVVLAGE